MQEADGKIYLLPAWPKDWDVDFKLHAPQQTLLSAASAGATITRRFPGAAVLLPSMKSSTTIITAEPAWRCLLPGRS